MEEDLFICLFTIEINWKAIHYFPAAKNFPAFKNEIKSYKSVDIDTLNVQRKKRKLQHATCGYHRYKAYILQRKQPARLVHGGR